MIGTTRPHYRILENAGRRPLDSREETEMTLASGAQVGRYRIVAVGSWKYIEPHQGEKVGQGTGIELGNDPEPQLYDLANDIGETRNVAREHPDKVEALAARLKQVRKGS